MLSIALRACQTPCLSGGVAWEVPHLSGGVAAPPPQWGSTTSPESIVFTLLSASLSCSVPQRTQQPRPLVLSGLAACSLTLSGLAPELRKLSDPVVGVRRDCSSSGLRQGHKPRCLSDGAAPDISRVLGANMEDFELRSEEGGSLAHGYDSGYHDDARSKAQDSLWSVADSEGVNEPPLTPLRRKITPYTFNKEAEPDTPLLVSHVAKQSLTRSSIGGGSSFDASSESHSLSSLWGCQSPETVTEILSSLGFDDYEDPRLIPDRFIPKEIEHVRPSAMRSQAMTSALPPVTPSQANQNSSTDLPLGATAENFLSHHPQQSLSPPPDPVPDTSPPSHPLFPATDLSHFYRSRATLEPVPEETASDLSPSPRWFSPRVSLDHSVDLAEGKLGASLLAKPRRRSLPQPQREGCKLSIGSQVESEPDSIYLSVTSYDDELAMEREREKEELSNRLALPTEDFSHRRRRRGVYTPPPNLMSWLSTQQPISEEDCQDMDPDELPWPFNEQVRLRKSLTEIQQSREPVVESLRLRSCSLSDRGSLSPEPMPSLGSSARSPSPPFRMSPEVAPLEDPAPEPTRQGCFDESPALEPVATESMRKPLVKQLSVEENSTRSRLVLSSPWLTVLGLVSVLLAWLLVS